MTEALADARAFRGWTLRGAQRHDEDFLFALHRQAVIVHGGTVLCDVGRISLTRHWRKIFLRDIELMVPERNHGVGTAIINAVLTLARNSDRYVELRVLRCNPAQRLYARLGFRVIDDDGARLRMRTL